MARILLTSALCAALSAPSGAIMRPGEGGGVSPATRTPTGPQMAAWVLSRRPGAYLSAAQSRAVPPLNMLLRPLVPDGADPAPLARALAGAVNARDPKAAWQDAARRAAAPLGTLAVQRDLALEEARGTLVRARTRAIAARRNEEDVRAGKTTHEALMPVVNDNRRAAALDPELNPDPVALKVALDRLSDVRDGFAALGRRDDELDRVVAELGIQLQRALLEGGYHLLD